MYLLHAAYFEVFSTHRIFFSPMAGRKYGLPVVGKRGNLLRVPSPSAAHLSRLTMRCMTLARPARQSLASTVITSQPNADRMPGFTA
jgi:hypothetical protein